MLKKALLAAVAMAAAVAYSAPAARATTLLTFAQSSSSNDIVSATVSGSTTTIKVTNGSILISQLYGIGPTSTGATLSLTATSTGPAQTIGSSILQNFSGSFSITSGSTNYLSGTFTDLVSGTGAAAGLSSSAPPDVITFTSSVIPANELGSPQGISFSFSNVVPSLSSGGSPATLQPFTANIGGTLSANTVTTVPEPLSLALLGSGLVALGFARRRLG